MTFEEFFTKKRIDLGALKKAEPGLFSEFKSHFEQMGEKSFDHTKKYWFNKLRRQYHLAPELKPEKVRIPNPLAEQTVTESLSETLEAPKPAPKPGFVPKFKAANLPNRTVEENQAEEEKPAKADAAAENPKPAAGLDFTPKFRAANTPKLAEAGKKEEGKPVEEKPAGSADAPAPRPAYKPRFNMKNIPPKNAE